MSPEPIEQVNTDRIIVSPARLAQATEEAIAALAGGLPDFGPWLVQMHGSELTVEPRPGGGSTFAFELEPLR